MAFDGCEPSAAQSADSRSHPDPTLRCRIFGHKWGAWIGGSWHTPNRGATRGAMISMAECKRCGLSWRHCER